MLTFVGAKLHILYHSTAILLESKKIFLYLPAKCAPIPPDGLKKVLVKDIMTMIQLDETDVKLLKALQHDAKMATKTLCDEVNLSKTPVYDRIRRLEKEGVIKGYTAVVDPKKVGLPLVVFCNVSVAVHDDEHIMRFCSEIAEIDEVMECYCTGGHYDFLLKVVLKDLESYNKFVFEKLTKVQGIIKMQSSFVLNEIKSTNVLEIKL